MSEIVIGVVGAGAMGAGIAQVAAVHGHRVLLADANPDALVRARQGHAAAMARDVEKQRRSADEASAVLSRLQYLDGVDAASLAPLAACGLVIEAIVERLDVKQTLFRALDAIVGSDTVLASNTSSLSIAAIAGACTQRERVVGIHFFNPAPLMPLVEIVAALPTDIGVVDRVESLVQSWGKTTVRVKDTPGFLVNRIARPFYGESLVLYDEGAASVATLDWALTTLGGFRMGPFTLMDMIGNDINFAVSCSVYESTFHDPRYRPSVTQQRHVEAGWLGRKSGRGYYRYDAGHTGFDVANAEADAVRGQALVDRVVAMLVNEAASARDLHLASAQDIETAMTKGVNYPRGLLAWGDQIGPDRVVHTLDQLHAEYGDPRYRVARTLRRVSCTGGSLLDG
ncbi:MAG: 3-hydroxybutyryl-CoA dehydrogenase [Gemmatimonadaceae bacterium]|nr:3-hydroxybutyryl-CoA dehydrogenase [Gemmatimonadaceae bacterium]